MLDFPSAEIEESIKRLSQGFLDDAGDSVQEMQVLLDRVADGAGEDPAALAAIRREAHGLKGLGGSFGFPAISLIAHRLEDHLAQLRAIAPAHVDDVRVFLDRLAEIIEAGADPGDAETRRLLRALPAPPQLADWDVQRLDCEVLLIAPASVLHRAVEAQLHSRGLRVVGARASFEAFEIAVRTRPDLIIASALMEGVDGIDLARAFAAMKATADIPFVLLTSFDRRHKVLRALPEGAFVLRHDRDLDGEMTRVLKQVCAKAPAEKKKALPAMWASRGSAPAAGRNPCAAAARRPVG